MKKNESKEIQCDVEVHFGNWNSKSDQKVSDFLENYITNDFNDLSNIFLSPNESAEYDDAEYDGDGKYNFKISLKDKIERIKNRRLLYFIHYSQWSDFEFYLEDIHEENKKNCCFFLYSGGGMSEDEKEQIESYAIKADMGKQVKVYIPTFPPEDKASIDLIIKAYKAFEKDSQKENPDWNNFSFVDINEGLIGFKNKDLIELISNLFAVDILLQGYLAAYSNEDHWLTIRKKFPIYEKRKRSLNVNNLFVSNEYSAGFWFDTISDNIPDKVKPFSESSISVIKTNSVKELRKEDQSFLMDCLFPYQSGLRAIKISQALCNGERIVGNTRGALRLIYELIKGKGNAFGFDISSNIQISEKNICDLFLKAHNEFENICSYLKTDELDKISELERKRSYLNHSRIKNDFINKLGTAVVESGVEKRSRQILDYWSYLRNEKKGIHNLDELKDSINQGLNNWPEIFDEIEYFLDNAPENTGYKRTEMFEKVRKHFFEGKNSKLKIISRFVDKFEKMADLPEKERNKWLEKFWEAADSIHDSFRKMRIGLEEDALFGEYFEKEIDKEKI
jgi:hypothetical protein